MNLKFTRKIRIKEGYKELTSSEIKTKELEILKYITDFCEHNNINYVLSDGSLIGAVRHKGFIPWDLDIDISMLREDYDKFFQLWKDTEDYSLLAIKNEPKSALSFIKVVDNNTICFENGLKTIKGGLWVDVFPLDPIPDNPNEAAKHFNRCVELYDSYNRAYWPTRFSFIQKIAFHVVWAFRRKDISLLWESVLKRYKKLLNEATKYSTDNNNVVNKMIIAIRPESRKFGFPKTCLTNWQYIQFENYSFRIPTDYDSMLKCYYGNYMELPPEEKRVDHHILRAFTIEETN